MDDKLEKILRACARIKNGRTMDTTKGALMNEGNELLEEMNMFILGGAPGVDGVMGEAVDVILVAVDAIYQANPNATLDEISAVIDRKLHKWETLYGTAEKSAETIAKKAQQ